MALKLGQKPYHSSPKPHQQQPPGCHTPIPSAKPDHLLGMSSLKRRGTNHCSSPSVEWGGATCDTMCWSSLQGLRQGLPGRPVLEAALCLWAEPAGPDRALGEGTFHRNPHITPHPSGRPLLCLVFLFSDGGRRV